MTKAFYLFLLSAALCVSFVACDFSLRNLFHQKTTTTEEPPTTTTTARSSIVISNNVPKVQPGCMVHFQCKKKLKEPVSPKPCVKYCVKNIQCNDGSKIHGKPDECFELDEAYVLQEYQQPAVPSSGTTMSPIMQVAMIDFPCQPGYLPDSRGRCREVW